MIRQWVMDGLGAVVRVTVFVSTFVVAFGVVDGISKAIGGKHDEKDDAN